MKLSLLTIFICFFISCAQEAEDELVATSGSCNNAVESKGSRLLGFDILDLTETGSFDDNIALGKSLGMEFIQIHLYWNALEIDTDGVAGAPYVMGFTDPNSTLASLNAVAKANSLKLSIIISPIDLPTRAVPVDLQASGLKFNNSIMSNRFNSLIDFLFNSSTGIVDPAIVNNFSVGNEITDYNWSGNGDTQAEYQTFLSNIKSKVNSYGLNLSFTGTLSHLVSSGTEYTNLANTVDSVSVTYYPQDSGFQVNDPSVVLSDLDSIVARFPGKTINLQEVGYQTSSSANSSETKQAEFFCNFFKAWDSNKSSIMSASILRLNDNSLASAQATAVTYGLPGNNAFIEYIRTLGLRSFNGTGSNKEAFTTIQSEANKRGW